MPKTTSKDVVYEPVTEWGAMGHIEAYDERKRLDNSGDGYRYFVDEDHSRTIPSYRIVRRPRGK